MLVAACGGAQAPRPEPPAPLVSSPVEAEPATEAYAQVSAFFDRRRPAVSQCYADALVGGKLAERARGYVTVALVVPPSGKPENVRIADSTLKSEAVEDCIVALVGRWLLPQPSETIDFSFSYNFQPE